MKKFFTYLFASAAFCMIGTVNTMAQDEAAVETSDFTANLDDFYVGKGSDDACTYDPATHKMTWAGYFDNWFNIKGCQNKKWPAGTQFFVEIAESTCPIRFHIGSDPAIVEGVAHNGVNMIELTEEKVVNNFRVLGPRYDTEGNVVPGECIIKMVKICLPGSTDKPAPTAINNVAAETAADGQRYNLAGQKVGKNAKGLYIMNGKKYMKK